MQSAVVAHLCSPGTSQNLWFCSRPVTHLVSSVGSVWMYLTSDGLKTAFDRTNRRRWTETVWTDWLLNYQVFFPGAQLELKSKNLGWLQQDMNRCGGYICIQICLNHPRLYPLMQESLYGFKKNQKATAAGNFFPILSATLFDLLALAWMPKSERAAASAAVSTILWSSLIHLCSAQSVQIQPTIRVTRTSRWNKRLRNICSQLISFYSLQFPPNQTMMSSTLLLEQLRSRLLILLLLHPN